MASIPVQVPSGVAHKPEIALVQSAGFQRDILRYSEEVLEAVYDAFTVNGLIGIPVDPDGYLNSCFISREQLALFYAVAKDASGLYLLGLHDVQFDSSFELGSIQGNLRELLAEAKRVGMPTKGPTKFDMLRKLMSTQPS